ncbi:circadian clock KaiB family protein [Longimicrobium sp.]|uniref:circadian clock KaiB family protein n=1 Tax=Longimicrobium sp. TaxID=2029185 RepID=UPI003B3A45B6
MTVRLVLYVAGDTPRSRSARATVAWLADGGVGERVEATVVDVAEDPERAETDRVLLTPTLLRQGPGSARRIVGDLGDRARVAEALGLSAPGPTSTEPSQ